MQQVFIFKGRSISARAKRALASGAIIGHQRPFASRPQAVVHEAALSRAAEGIAKGMESHRPDVWTSDRYSAQQVHAQRQRTCLAHLDRKAHFADDNGEDDIPFRLRVWLDRVFALGRVVTTFAASTLRTQRRALQRDLAAILSDPTRCRSPRNSRAKSAAPRNTDDPRLSRRGRADQQRERTAS